MIDTYEQIINEKNLPEKDGTCSGCEYSSIKHQLGPEPVKLGTNKSFTVKIKSQAVKGEFLSMSLS